MSPRADLRELYEKLGVTPQGRAISELCRTGLPLRMPRSGRQSSAGGFTSEKMGVVMGTESRTMERAYFRLIDGDADFLEFYEQAYRLRLTVTKKDGKRGSFDHIPDLFAIRRSWIGFIEIKTTAKLQEKAAEQPNRFICSADGKWTSPVAEDALANTGLGYRIVTDQDINPILVRNLNFLRDFVRPG